MQPFLEKFLILFRNKQPFFAKNLDFSRFFIFGRKSHHTAGAAETNMKKATVFRKVSSLFE